MATDYLKTLISIFIKQGRSTAAKYHLIYEEKYSEAEAISYIKQVKEVVDMEEYD